VAVAEPQWLHEYSKHQASRRMISRIRTYLTGEGLGPTLVKAVTGSAGLRIAGMGFGFLVGVQLARGLGAEGYGIYGVAMSIIALLTVPTEFGLPQLLTREVAAAQVRQDWGRMKGILRWATTTSLWLSLLVAIGLLAWLWLSGRGIGSMLGMTLLAGVLMIPVVAQVSLRSAALRGLQQIVRGQLPDVVLRPAFYSLLLFLVPLWLVPLTPSLGMALGAVSACFALLVVLVMLKKTLPAQVESAAPVIEARNWWSSALPMALTEGMRLLQGHLLILLLGIMATMSEVGVYRVASSMMLLIAMPISLFNIVGMPVIARLHATKDRARLQRFLGLTAAGMTLGVAVLALPFLLQGKWVLATVFGAEFADGNAILLALCGSAFIYAAFGIVAALLNMTGYQKQVTRASIVALLCLMVLAYPMIHFFGVMGAAISDVASTLVWNLIMWVAARKQLKLDTSLLALSSRGKARTGHGVR